MKKSKDYSDEEFEQLIKDGQKYQAMMAKPKKERPRCIHPMESTTTMFSHMDSPVGWRCNACGHQEWYR